MKAIIIEDESRAADRLRKMILEVIPNMAFYQTISSVEESIDFFRSGSEPDVIFLDVELADGRSFEIFRNVEIKSPVIFTTAYDQYALDAFKHNGIDYLLKPIRKEELETALQKVEKSKQGDIDYDKLAEAVERRSKKYIQRILVRFADQLIHLDLDEVLYFQIREGAVYAQSANGIAYPVDFSLEQLEKSLNPDLFFRINRKGIVAMSGISKMYAYSRSRVKIEVKKGELLEPVVSTDRSGAFKRWLEDDYSIE
jgi:DNA-binding LytR/AlgR family response regulator